MASDSNDSWSERFRRHYEFVADRMSPEFGLVDKLYARKILTSEAKNRIKNSTDAVQKKNRKLLKSISTPEEHEKLVEVLKESDQAHLVKYLENDGDYKTEFGGEWPLTEKEIDIIQTNYEALVDLVDSDGLLNRLYASRVINERQREFISLQKTTYDKNEALLEILRRSSLASYWQTIRCLHADNQTHIADILDTEGVIIRFDAVIATEADIDETEEELVARINSLLGDVRLQGSRRVLEGVWRLRLIAARRSSSVALYFLCSLPSDVDRLQGMAADGSLRRTIEKLFNGLIESSAKIQVTLRTEKLSRAFAHGRQAIEGMKRKPSIEPIKQTNIEELPYEVLDVILQKSYLCSVLRKERPKTERDETIIQKLALADAFWLNRITRPRLKRAIWSQISRIYRRKYSAHIIHKNNQQLILENISPTTDAKALKSSDCLSDVESTALRQVEKSAGKKQQLANQCIGCSTALNSRDKERHETFVRYLRFTRHTLLAKVVENGGAAVQIRIRSSNATVGGDFVNRLNCLKDKNQLKSVSAETAAKRLKEDEIDILGATVDRDAAIWIWCKSQNSLEKLKEMNASSRFVDLLRKLTEEVFVIEKSKDVSIDCDQLKKRIDFCPVMTVDFAASLCFEEEEILHAGLVNGVAKLNDRIYVLPQRITDSGAEVSSVICVFEAENSFRMLEKIEFKEIRNPRDIGPSEKDDCLYVIDSWIKCIWKVMDGGETEEQHKRKAVKWLDFGEDFHPWTLSVSADGHLLMISEHLPISLRVYAGSEATLLHSADLPQSVCYPVHAVQTTSTGNFVVVHLLWEQTAEYTIVEGVWVVTELSRDGKTVVRRFVPEDEDQKLDIHPSYYEGYLGVDSKDRIFVADTQNDRVILFDANLRWSQILISAKEEVGEEEGGGGEGGRGGVGGGGEEGGGGGRGEQRETGEQNLRRPRRLFYSESTKQLVVAGDKQVNVYRVKIN